MRKDKLSRTQLMALLWAGSLAPAAELLPTLLLPTAGRGAWLSVLCAAPLVLAAGWLLGGLAGREGLARAIRRLLGPVLGPLLLLIYMAWGELLLALRLRLCAQRLLASGYRSGALWTFLLVLAALVLWMGMGKLSAFARAGQLFLAALLAASGVVLGLALLQVRPERLLPILPQDGPAILASALPAAGTLGWGLFIAFLLGAAEDQGERKGWHWLFWGLGGCLLLALAQAVILGNLGTALAARLENPFFALAKSVGVEGAFQRVESVVAALWTFSDLSMAGVILFALQAAGAEACPRIKEKAWAAGSLILAAAAALAAFPALGTARLWSGQVAPWGNLALGAAAPGLLSLLGIFQKKRGGGGISCGKRRV